HPDCNSWRRRWRVSRLGVAQDGDGGPARNLSHRAHGAPGSLCAWFHTFTGSDTAKSQAVAIVNEAFARRFYRNQNLIGKTIRMLPPPELIPPPPPGQRPEPLAPYRTVVGVIGDLKNNDANQPADPEVFVPYTQYEGEGWGSDPMFAVRTDQD